MLSLRWLLMMSLGTKIVMMRKQRGLSQGQLAELLNIHQSMVTRWEKDKVLPKRETLSKLAQIFEVKPEELFASSRTEGLRQATYAVEDPKLLELLGQLNRLSPKDLEALKSVLEAMLTKARVQEAIGA
jgi:transcriptional regulator with XRE-family HTH domain